MLSYCVYSALDFRPAKDFRTLLIMVLIIVIPYLFCHFHQTG